MRRLICALIISVLAFCSVADTPWVGVVDSARATDWSVSGVRGGIPERETICQTLTSSATSSTIESAIANCGAGETVYLAAGTYTLSAGITFAQKSNVTLRGAGADQTILNITGETQCHGYWSAICISASSYPASWAPPGEANWTAGYSQGTTTITLSNTTDLYVGSIIVLNQLNDSAPTSDVFNCSATPTCSSEGPGGAGEPGVREQLAHREVTAINGSQVSFTEPLDWPQWRSGQSPKAWWGIGVPPTGNGVEDLTINHTGGSNGIVLFYVTDSWLKGVRSVNAPRNHVLLTNSMYTTIKDSYFEEGQNHASQSYGVEAEMGSFNLIENNIFHKVTAPLMSSGGSTGNIYSYNFSRDNTYSPSPTWFQPSSYFHAAGIGYVLHEGNQGAGVALDQVHGPAHFITFFRNQFDGWETGKTQQTVPVHISAPSRYTNIIGNVLGKDGHHSKYESYPGDTANCETSIYAMGLGGNCANGGGSFPANDDMVRDSSMRWGNYDTVTGAPRFVSGEVPSGLTPYGNPVPASQTLPASFYLTAKPAWWGSVAWPAVGPDVTNGDVAGLDGYAYANPARVCYDNATKDGNGAMTNFNAASCYPLTTGDPAQPKPVTDFSVVSYGD